MSNWKAWFQERQLFQRLLEQPLGRLPVDEALASVQGEGHRLDTLIRQGWLLREAEEVWAGPALRFLHPSTFPSTQEEVAAYWQFRLDQLLQQVTALLPISSAAQADTCLRAVSEARLLTLQLRQRIREAPGDSDLEALLPAIQSFSQAWQTLVLVSTHGEELEREQVELIHDLESWIREWQARPAPTSSPQRDRMERLRSLPESVWREHPELRGLLESGRDLVLHDQLGLVTASPGTDRRSQPAREEAPKTLTPLPEPPTLAALFEAFLTARRDLYSFLETHPDSADLSESERLHWFSLLLQAYSEQLRFVAIESQGQEYWEVWPKL